MLFANYVIQSNLYTSLSLCLLQWIHLLGLLSIFGETMLEVDISSSILLEIKRRERNSERLSDQDDQL